MVLHLKLLAPISVLRIFAVPIFTIHLHSCKIQSKETAKYETHRKIPSVTSFKHKEYKHAC